MSNDVTFENKRQNAMRRLVRPDGTLAFDIVLATDRGPDTVSTTLALAGPGQMVGLTGGTVRKVHPPAGAGNHRGGELAFLELRDPDLPWAFSLDGGPTIGLICVPDDDGVVFDQTTVPNPILTVTGGGATLPSVSLFETMAHVHRQDTQPPFARLLCPQELRANTRYIAVLVPLTQQGRNAGLGTPPERVGDLTAPAWSSDPGPLRLPVLHSWRFGTGSSRGAEDILRDLHKSELTSTPETLPLTLESAQALGLPPSNRVSRATLLVSQTSRFETLPSLVPALNARAANGAPRMPLPSYGRIYAQAEDAGTGLSAQAPRWFSDLNHTVSYRLMAGLGAELVRTHQDEIITFIRDSAGAVEEANAILSRGHLSQRLAQQAFNVLDQLDDEAFVRLAGPALTRTRARTQTPSASTTSAAARLVGSAHGAAAHPALRRRIGRGASRLSQAGGSLANAIASVSRTVRVAHDIAGAAPLLRWHDTLKNANLVFLPEERRTDPLETIKQLVDVPPDRLGARGNAQRDRGLRDSADDTTVFEFLPAGPPVLPDSLAQDVIDDIRAGLNPANAIPPRLRARITGAPEMDQTPLPKRLLHDPVWPEPILERLFDLDPASLAPGLSDMKANRVLGLTLDGAALEAVVAGANHEVLRELVWRGLPIGRRPSPIRRAFPTLNDPAADSAPEFDLAPMANWDTSAPLGAGWSGRIGFMALMRTDLFHKHPDVLCYLCPALRQGNRFEPDPNADLTYPVALGQIGLDMIYLGFDASETEMRGGPLDTDPAGMFLIFEVPKEGLSFGLGGRNGASPRSLAQIAADGGWQTLDWDDLPDPVLTGLNQSDPVNGQDAGNLGGLKWGRSAADMAAILREEPVLLALHGADLLGNGT